MASPSALLRSRVRRPSYLSKLAEPADLLHHFPNGAYIGWSGFTGVGYPKKIPTALADHVEREGLQGKLKYNLFVGASSGAETENRWADLDMIERRAPHQVGKSISKGINEGRIKFFDKVGVSVYIRWVDGRLTRPAFEHVPGGPDVWFLH